MFYFRSLELVFKFGNKVFVFIIVLFESTSCFQGSLYDLFDITSKGLPL